MCTALTLHAGHSYLGRNLDLECSLNESITITPRNFPLPFRHMPPHPQHHAMIGMACPSEGYPLYYEAMNEFGLAMAGLNFPGNARYFPPQNGRNNIAPFELIPWVLGQCSSVEEARPLLDRLNLCSTPFSEQLPLSPLHWILSDRDTSLTIESTGDGLHIYPNPPGILTNNPPFPYQMTFLAQYMALGPAQPENRLSGLTHLPHYSRGMGALGLPGDMTSPSRFVRAAFYKANAISGPELFDGISQCFHILEGVAHLRGTVEVSPGVYEYTVYSSCCDLNTGIYYYRTYENSQITAVDMHRETLDGTGLICYPKRSQQNIFFQNKKG